MTNRLTSSSSPASDLMQVRLYGLRLGLLRLHKTLLDFERITYERFHGRVETSGELLQLVLNHGWFAWLRPVSELVVQIDNLLGADEPITVGDATALIDQTRLLLNPSETGSSFEKQYHNALQYSPDVVLAHANLSQILAVNV
jgi:hypothetical protein